MRVVINLRENEWAGERDARAHCERLFSQPGTVVELRALGVQGVFGGVESGYFDNADDLIAVAARLDGRAEGIYVTINPVHSALLARRKNRTEQRPKATTADADIECRRRWLVDVDPVRPSGISATDAELQRAYAVAREIREFLRQRGFPEPLRGASGNGAHLVFAIDLPVADDGLVKSLLDALAFRFNTEHVTVDAKVYNPARISKLYGTMACKGDSTPDRPHRRSQIIANPEEMVPVPERLLRELAAEVPANKPEDYSGRGEGFDLAGYITQHGLDVARTAPWQGGVKYVLGTCRFDPAHTDNSAYIVQFANGAIAAGCHHNGCAGKGWKELRNLLEPERSAKETAAGPDSRVQDKDLAEDDVIKPERRPFPIEILPPVVGDFVRAVAESRSVDISAPAALALSAISSAIGLSRVAWDEYADWVEIPVLWLALVSSSGKRKSPIIEDLFGPHMARQQEFIEKYEAALAGYNQELDNWKQRQRKNKSLEAEPRPEQPELEHVYTSDTTPEGLVDILRTSPRGPLVLADELTAFFGGLGRYTGMKDAERAFYLSLFRGVQYKKDRKGAPTVLIDRAAAAIIGGVQPGILRKCFDEEAFASGLASRFLLVCPPPQV